MDMLRVQYQFLGQNETAKLLGFIGGFLGGLTLTPGLIIPLFIGLVFAVVSSLLAGFINSKLPDNLKSLVGVIMLVSLLAYIAFVAGVLRLTSYAVGALARREK